MLPQEGHVKPFLSNDLMALERKYRSLFANGFGIGCVFYYTGSDDGSGVVPIGKIVAVEFKLGTHSR